MTPEQLVPTLETCKLLKEAGFKQDCYFYFFASSLECGEVEYDENPEFIFPAPTLQELLEELPKDTTPVNVLNVVKSYSGDFSVGYWDCTTQQIEPEFLDTNAAEAAALLWLELRKEAV